MTAPAKSRAKPKANGSKANGQPNGGTLAGAIAYEEAIAQEAAKVREEAAELTPPERFLKLWPLLRRPIPQGFIVTTPVVKGKPYISTGIKSVQVCIDRMDNVLTPLGWRERVEYADDGKVCTVTVEVLAGPGPAWTPEVLASRSSAGGVNQASTEGNLRKGSYTNAAKRAFAMLGVGHEVYLGATDLDPDVSEDAAKAQEATPAIQEAVEAKLPPEKVESLVKILAESAIEVKHLDAKLRSFGAREIADLTVQQGIALWEWISLQKGRES